MNPRIDLRISPDRPTMYFLNLMVDGRQIRSGLYRRAEIPQVIREGMDVVGELVLEYVDATELVLEYIDATERSTV